MGILDLLFPKYCVGCRKSGEYICANCFSQISFDTQSICTVCNRLSIDGRTHPVCKTRYTLDGTFCAVAYKRIVRKLIYQLKYQPYLTDLLPTLGELCYESCIQNELFVGLLQRKPILVPIPLSSKRLRKRGYNQAELLAKELGKRFNLEVQPLLKRVKETKPQYGLKRDKRIENMSNAFDTNPNVIANIVKQSQNNEKIATNSSSSRNDGIKVILVDDLLTTGSTMSEAAKLLKKNGIREVWGVAFAKD